MSEELITAESATLAQLHAVFDAALFKVTVNAETQALQITGTHVLWVFQDATKRHLRFFGAFQLPEGWDLGAKLTLANRINTGLRSIRAAISGTQQERLNLDLYLPLRGGVTRKCIALVFKQFEALVAAAVQELEAFSKTMPTLQVKSSFPESRETSDRAMLSSPSTPRFWR